LAVFQDKREQLEALTVNIFEGCIVRTAPEYTAESIALGNYWAIAGQY
jgi:hypothetical protein